jgi:hypothetical protein
MALPAHELKALAIQLSAAMPPVPFTGLGVLLEHDLHRLRGDATPKWRARDGEGAGVPVAVVDDLLDQLITLTGRADASDGEHDLRFILRLVQRVMRRQDQHRNTAANALARLMRDVGEVDEATADDLETLRLCAQPIDRVWEGC